MVDPRPFEKIQPVAIDLTHPDKRAPAAPEQVGGARASQRRWGLPVAGAVVILALGVLFLAPEWIVPERQPLPPAPPAPVAAQPEASPYSEAQLAEARRAAQDILASILERQKALDAKQVELWGAQPFADAQVLAEQGDALYRQRDFPAALDLYQQALDALQTLEASLDEVIAGKLSSGDDALAAGDETTAALAFEQVLAIEPGHPQAAAGLARARLLPKTRPLMSDAQARLAAGDLDGGRQLLEQVLSIDAVHGEARKMLDQVLDTQAEQRFNAAMSDGLIALKDGKLDLAAGAFRRALAARPEHPDARAALDQANRRLAAIAVDRQLAAAAEFERKEQWQDAAVLYASILAGDDSVVPARVGQLRSSARAQLDSAIAAILDNPLRLASPTVFGEGQQLLTDARAIPAPGPRLRGQANALAAALATSQIPVTVRLQSDNRTQVTVLRVAELGAFSQHELALKPGHYVALGSREGYRDVRVEFQVANESRTPIVISCKDPV